MAAVAANQNLFCTLAWFENLVELGFESQARLHLLLGTDNAGQQYLLPLDGARARPLASASASALALAQACS